MNDRILNFLKIIALIECLTGFILLSIEIKDYLHLPTLQNIENQFGEIVTWFKYKENCYKNFFLYSLLIITGISFWINKKLYCGLTQVLLITLFFVIIINLCSTSLFNLGVDICLGILSLIIFIYLEVKIYGSLFLQTLEISKMVKLLFFVGGGLSCAIWLFL